MYVPVTPSRSSGSSYLATEHSTEELAVKLLIKLDRMEKSFGAYDLLVIYVSIAGMFVIRGASLIIEFVALLAMQVARSNAKVSLLRQLIRTGSPKCVIPIITRIDDLQVWPAADELIEGIGPIKRGYGSNETVQLDQQSLIVLRRVIGRYPMGPGDSSEPAPLSELSLEIVIAAMARAGDQQSLSHLKRLRDKVVKPDLITTIDTAIAEICHSRRQITRRSGTECGETAAGE